MKSIIIRSNLLVLFAAIVMQQVSAQRTSRKKTNANQTDTTTQQVTNNNQPSGYNPYGNIPIVVDSSGMLDTVVKKSLRNDNAFDKSSLTARTPLPYEYLRWDDALYAKKFGVNWIFGKK